MNMAKAIDWLKANYDRAVLMAAAVFLFVCALAIWWSAIQFGNRLDHSTGSSAENGLAAAGRGRA